MAESNAQPRPHRRRVPRWVWFVVVCIALGAMTSVGVAWACVWQFFERVPDLTLRSWARTGTTHPERGELWWFVQRDESFGMTIVSGGLPEKGPDPFVDDVYVPDHEAQNWMRNSACQAALGRIRPQLSTREYWGTHLDVRMAGWPCRCVAMHFVSDTKYVATLITSGWEHDNYNEATIDPSFRIPNTQGAILISGYALPLGPLWPGLLANTAIYGGAWAVLIGGPILLRRWLRARRGGCPQCAYSREGLKEGAPCPECGRATPAAHDATPTPAAPTAR